MNVVKENAKALAALLTALGTWGATAAADGAYSGEELWGLCGVAVVGLSTWVTPNAVKIRSTKKYPPAY